MTERTDQRRTMLKAGLAAAGAAAAFATRGAAAAEASLMPEGAKTLRDLHERLAKTPRHRDYKAVPMIVDNPEQWDDAALKEIMAYRGEPKQVWDSTDLAGPWLNLMRNSLNGQVWAFRHPNFLAVAATHGPAHLALFDQAMWDKYQITKLTKGKFTHNTWAELPKAASEDPKNFENPEGPFSPRDNSIPALQRRGVVFLACHNAIWEIAEKLMKAGSNPDKLSHDQVTAELTNHLIPDVVLTPGIVATIPELQRVGFHYAK